MSGARERDSQAPPFRAGQVTTVKNSSSCLKPKSIEEKILHDANLLDALGAIGIARSFMKGGYENQTLDMTLRILKDNMRRKVLTSGARYLADERRMFMEKFIEKLEEELYDNQLIH